MGTRVRRTAVSIGMVLVLLAVTAGSAVAAPKDTWKFTWSGYSAEASSGDCFTVGDVVTCEGIGVYLFAGKTREARSGANRGVEVCVNIYTDAFNHVTNESIFFTNEYGCTRDLGAGTGIARDLSSATIALTTLTLQQDICDQNGCTLGGEREVDVEGVFTAISPAGSQSYRSVWDDGICTVRDSFKGTSRGAEFLGTVDGQTLEASAEDFNAYSQIGNGTGSYRSTTRRWSRLAHPKRPPKVLNSRPNSRPIEGPLVTQRAVSCLECGGDDGIRTHE